VSDGHAAQRARVRLRAQARVLVRVFAALALLPAVALAHGVSTGDKGYIMETIGTRIVPFMYLGAKHMVTGYDHLLFLVGVIFYLYRLRDVGVYVTLFAVGHSITLLAGVLTGVHIDAHLIDAVIGASVAYKALDNLGLLARWFGRAPDARAATMLFGLCHGLGLATKMLDFELASDGLVANLVAFNVGVELGQLLALSAILVAMAWWRRSASFARWSTGANVALLVSGMLLVAYQLQGWFTGTPAA